MDNIKSAPNRLINETSPYLLQHAYNPVDWYPWGEEAFAKGRREDKPIFLSIGYSTCHWCHVMAHESFENESVAKRLNADFVCVKVDREERPDVDSVYMRFCTALNGSGGWPLTVIMTPEQLPFYVGTYLPPKSFGGRIGLLPLLEAVAEKWQKERGDLLKAGNDIYKYLSAEQNTGAAEPSAAFLKSAADQLGTAFDETYGGFGTAPKFPTPQNLLFLLRYAYFSGDKSARSQVELTLRQMYRGGIYDHIGGGFARYSTDREWLAPHFEKTLYDNALLALCYTEAWQDGRMAYCRTVAVDTLDYCLRSLRHPDGGFFCGQDADVDAVEGAGCTFTLQEIETVLGADDGRHFAECYDITAEGNFNGKSIPNLLLNNRWNLLPEGYGEFCKKLLDYRSRRGIPATDTKILTAWNGMMLSALSRAGRVFSVPGYIEAAEKLAEFIQASLTVDGALMSSCCAGRAVHSAQLDDYVFYALGLLELYDARHDIALVIRAKALAEKVVSLFPAENGGYYRTSAQSEKLILRPMEIFDAALPSGNSGAAVLFDRLYRLTGESKWSEVRDNLLSFICARSEKYPSACPLALTALMSVIYPTKELVWVCAGDMETLPEGITSRYAPELSILMKTAENSAALAAAAPFTAPLGIKNGRSTFYICSGGVCQVPMNN